MLCPPNCCSFTSSAATSAYFHFLMLRNDTCKRSSRVCFLVLPDLLSLEALPGRTAISFACVQGCIPYGCGHRDGCLPVRARHRDRAAEQPCSGVHLRRVAVAPLQYGVPPEARIAALLSAEDHVKQNLEGGLHTGAGKPLCSVCTVTLGQAQKGSVGKRWKLRFAPQSREAGGIPVQRAGSRYASLLMEHRCCQRRR